MNGLEPTCAVLVVEDDGDLREMMCLALEQEGLDPQPARDGLEALEMLRSGEAQPDVILLDMMMPRLDGRAFMRERAQDASMTAIPVVVLSAVPPDQLRAPGAAFLQKPCDFDALLDAIWAQCDGPAELAEY